MSGLKTGAAPPRITWSDAERAWDEWGCNCGPAAIAAVTGKSLDEVRPHMGDFESKRYTNPTLMWAALRSLGVRFSFRGGDLGRERIGRPMALRAFSGKVRGRDQASRHVPAIDIRIGLGRTAATLATSGFLT